MKRTLFFLALASALLCQQVAASKKEPVVEGPADAIAGLIRRVVPQYANIFVPQLISQPIVSNGNDYFEVETVDSQIVLRGTSGVAIASALNWYLKTKCNSLITWLDSSVSCPSPMPVVSPKYTAQTPHKWRYYYNVCTFGYTSVWWDWARWEREIDWMALNGINMPLAFNGQEILWEQVFSEMGISEQGMDEFFTGPAFLPWQRMGNVNMWGGPLSRNWMIADSLLQKRILARERALGMKAVLPAFAGHVPGRLAAKYPSANITKMTGWGSFNSTYGTWYLSPNDQLFTQIGTRFVELLIQTYGTDHFYNSDPFNELTPPSNDPQFLADSARVIYKSLSAADAVAVWVLQGWFLYNDQNFWQPPQAQAFLDAIDPDDIIVLDLFAEIRPQWQRTQNFYGRPFVWNMLHNFGGRTGLYGALPKLAMGVFEAMNDPQSTLVGVGLTPEATETNYVVYDLWSDIVWMPADSKINLPNWLTTFAYRRYNTRSANLASAWSQLLGPGVYNCPTDQQGTSGSMIAARPGFNMERVGCCAVVAQYWNPQDNWHALSRFLASPLPQSETYLNDLTEVTRQVLSDASLVAYHRMEAAFNNKDETSLSEATSLMLTFINFTENVLATRSLWLTGTWIEAARAKATNDAEAMLYEINARTQITLWGPRDSGLHEYAYHLWSGITGDLYAARWRSFGNELLDCLQTGRPFNQDAFDQFIMDMDYAWTLSTKRYPTKANGDSTIQIAQKTLVLTSSIFTSD